MDNIKQYQRLSDIKPSYQKLTLPYHSVSKLKIKHNLDELELHYKGLGIWEEPNREKKKVKGGSYQQGVVIMDFDLSDDAIDI